MPIDQTLSRVDDDLAHGRVLPAVNRLRSLAHGRPDRLDVRERLAAVYRSQGETAQAGRWSYLAEHADPAEVAAFERQFRTPGGRLRAIAWDGDDDTLGPLARTRLRSLHDAAAQEPQDAADDVRTARFEWGCLGIAVAVLGLTALAVVGLVTVVRWTLG
ncbi:hypothetical protein ATJ88_3000 [Isoptericola jiangsuensis]|uniref:Uncharacterized protein n=1 Tax=Isoptericola jiangsuensis TaxID=548579 RepID=A0A2A9EZI0_9MICO|nr:DUF6584 family protein [Isoptericola jiangsuensis]PFG44278.1 hypothetical protein ATJ88_3000 [Isoptericola jiangsuensis]